MINNIKLIESMSAKPLESTWRLVNALAHKGIDLSVNEDFVFAKQRGDLIDYYIYILLEGRISAYKRGNKLLIGTLNAPGLIGIPKSKFRYVTYNFKQEPNSVVKRINYDDAIAIIKQQSLFEDMLEYQSFMSDFQTYRDIIFTQGSTYKVLCLLLIELSHRSLEERLKISVISYILERSSMSRSGALKMLAELRVGKYIIMEKGKLMEVCRIFPEKF